MEPPHDWPKPGTSAEAKRSRGKAALELLDARLVQIRRYQVKFSVCVLVGTAIWYVLLLVWFKGDTARANHTFTNSFQFLCVAYVCWFMVPYFLRVEAKQDVGLAMGHDSVDIMAKVDGAIEARAERADRFFARGERLLGQLEGGKGPLVEKLRAIAREAAAEVRKEIAGAKGRTENELEKALAEGEAEAARIAADSRPAPPRNA